MVVVITLFILANVAIYIVPPLDVLQSTNAVATIDHYSSFIETEGPRLSAMNFLDV